MKIINSKVFVMIVVMAMVLSIGTTSLGEEIDLEELVAEETVVEEIMESTVIEDPVTDEAQEEESPPAEEESSGIEEPVQEDPEVEVVIEEMVDETEQGLEDEVLLIEEEEIPEEVIEEEVTEEIVDEIDEVIPEDVQEEEEIIEDGSPVEEGTAIEESIAEEVMEGETIPVEPLTPELQIVEPVFEELIVPRYVSLHIGVEPNSERYTNGDMIQHEIIIENNGTDPIESLDIVDDMGVDESIGYLDIGERALVKGSFGIDDYNRVDSIGNTVDVSATCDGERISGKVGFVVPVEIPQGSITISNSVKGEYGGGQDFLVLVEGPNNYLNYLDLGESESVTIRDLFIGDYRIRPLDSMNFSWRCTDERISLTTSSLNRDIYIEYSLENIGWFSGSDNQTVKVMDVESADIDFSKIELQSSGLDKRSDEIYLDLEPLIVLVEVQVEALQQPEGEDSSSVADPVQDVTSDPVEAGLQEEVTQPDAAEGPGELGQEGEIQDEGLDPLAGGQDENLEEPEPALEDDNQEIELVEPEAVIPEDPLGESKAEGEAETVDDEGEGQGEIELQEEITTPTDLEDLSPDSV